MATTQTMTAILDAAEQLFATHGIDGTSIREITRVADVNVAGAGVHAGDGADQLDQVGDGVVHAGVEGGDARVERVDMRQHLRGDGGVMVVEVAVERVVATAHTGALPTARATVVASMTDCQLVQNRRIRLGGTPQAAGQLALPAATSPSNAPSGPSTSPTDAPNRVAVVPVPDEAQC